MTQNQLAFQKNLETERANRASEQIKSEANLIDSLKAKASQTSADAALKNALVNEYLERFNAEALASKATLDTVNAALSDIDYDYRKVQDQSNIWKNWMSGLGALLKGVGSI